MSINPGTIKQLELSGHLPDALEDELSDRWDDLTFAASSITVNPIGALASPARDETETGFPGTLLFSGTVDNVLAGIVHIKHSVKAGSALKPHIHWSKPAGGSGDDVTWEFYYRIINRGAAPGNWSNAVSGTLAINHNGTAEAEAITTFGEIATGGLVISTSIAWRLYRRGSSDSFAGTARLIELDFHALFDSRGSRQEYVK